MKVVSYQYTYLLGSCDKQICARFNYLEHRYSKKNKDLSRPKYFKMLFQHRLITIPKKTKTSAGSNFSTFNFALHKTFIELVLTTNKFQVARTLHSLSGK